MADGAGLFCARLPAGAGRRKGKEAGALAARGRANQVKKSPALSFHRLEDISLYLHRDGPADSDCSHGGTAALAL